MELEKYSHPLNDQQPGVYHFCKGQVAPDTGNVQNALAIGGEQSRQFSASLSSHCHGEGHLRHRDAVHSAVSRGAAAQHWYSRCLPV